ncbi:DUF2079 domain-containing protein [Synechocystis sp. PCC 7509]|uniref:DUF2079 domain-containing protein n=1 Tax=Synechocystis sp. PCC 7509 TaxID=927677 RepID=UPI0002ABF5A0|nr:DUF2079 domain-containing protein [Synechocystis sp. PCC 7509]
MLGKLRQQPSLWLVTKVASIFFVFCLIFILHRYYTFYASFDQGIFNQVFWNGTHGRMFQSSLSSSLSTNVVHNSEVPEVFYHRLGQHFTPALLLWLPLYALIPSPATLSVLQVILITAAGFVLYALARHYLEPPLAAMIAISFYGANAVIGPTLSNFHDLSQIPLFVFSLLWAMEKRKWWLFWLLIVLTLAVREDSGVVLFSLGFYLIVSKRYPQIGLMVCTLSLSYMLVLTNAIMPLFSDDISRRFMIERFGHFTDQEEATTLDIIWAIVSKPWQLLMQLFSPWDDKIKYLLGHWLPLAFIPAISGAAWVVTGFPLLQIFLQQGESRLAITIRYALTVVPGLFYGAILWYAHHPKQFKPSFQRFWCACICLSLVFTLTSNPSRTFYFLIPDSIQPWVHISLPQQWHHVRQARKLLAQIPSGASVSATTYLVPPLSSRREIVRFPMLQLRNDAREVVSCEYAIADLWQLQQYQAAFKGDRQLLIDSVKLINQIVGDRQYGIIDYTEGIVLLQKAALSSNQATAAWFAYQNQLKKLARF